jgi:hypothetical protein
MVMTATIVKMTLQLLILLLIKRIDRWSKKAKAILLATVTINSGFIRKDMENCHGKREHKRRNMKTPVCVLHYNKWMGGIGLKD